VNAITPAPLTVWGADPVKVTVLEEAKVPELTVRFPDRLIAEDTEASVEPE